MSGNRDSPLGGEGSQLERAVISNPIVEDTTNEEKSQDSEILNLKQLQIETVEGTESGLSKRSEIDASNLALFINRLINELISYQEDGFEDSPTTRVVNWGSKVLNKLDTLTEEIVALKKTIKEVGLKVSGDGRKQDKHLVVRG